jgi:CheY-like chemotaxis protein
MTGNGRDCVDRAATGGYDVILMDIQMPTMDGVDATLLIRAMTGPASKTPIIALTANASSTERERYIAAGMDAHVSKPVSIDALTAAIASVTDTAPPCGSATSLRAVPSPRASRSVTPRRGRTTIPPQATIPRPDQRP